MATVRVHEPRVPERALLILAHPDDAEFICGGAVAKWARAGAQIRKDNAAGFAGIISVDELNFPAREW